MQRVSEAAIGLSPFGVYQAKGGIEGYASLTQLNEEAYQYKYDSLGRCFNRVVPSAAVLNLVVFEMEDTARAPFIAGLPSHQRDTDAMDAIESPVRIAGDFPPLNLDVPMDRKWTVLKPILQRLYCEEKRKLMVISEILTDEYGFRAT